MNEQHMPFRKARLRGMSRVSRSLQEGESTQLIDDVLDMLRPKVTGFAELKESANSLSTTIVGIRRYRKDHRDERGPKPHQVAQSVPGLWEPVAARLGPLSFMGSGLGIRLAFLLDSPEMTEQEQLYAMEFETLGYELNELLDGHQYEYKPHLTCGLPLSDSLNDKHTAERKLEAFNNAIEPYFGEELVFAPAFSKQTIFSEEIARRHLLPPRCLD